MRTLPHPDVRRQVGRCIGDDRLGRSISGERAESLFEMINFGAEVVNLDTDFRWRIHSVERLIALQFVEPSFLQPDQPLNMIALLMVHRNLRSDNGYRTSDQQQ